MNAAGARAEEQCVQFLRTQGLAILERNWRCRHGELDLVARDGDETVFVEVKTRAGDGFGHPFEAITARKLARLRRLALEWCGERGAPAGRIRIDAIAVFAPASAPAIVEHLEGIA